MSNHKMQGQFTVHTGDSKTDLQKGWGEIPYNAVISAISNPTTGEVIIYWVRN